MYGFFSRAALLQALTRHQFAWFYWNQRRVRPWITDGNKGCACFAFEVAVSLCRP